VYAYHTEPIECQWRPIWLYIRYAHSYHTRVTDDIVPRLRRILEKLPFGLNRAAVRRSSLTSCSAARMHARARAGHETDTTPENAKNTPSLTPGGLIMILGVLFRVLRLLRYRPLRMRSTGAYLLFRPPPCAGTFIIVAATEEKQTEIVDGRDWQRQTTETLKHKNSYARYVFDTRPRHG